MTGHWSAGAARGASACAARPALRITVHRSLFAVFFGFIGSIGLISLIGSFIKTRLPETCLWGRSPKGEAPNTLRLKPEH